MAKTSQVGRASARAVVPLGVTALVAVAALVGGNPAPAGPAAPADALGPRGPQSWPVTVLHSAKHDVSPPLRSLADTSVSDSLVPVDGEGGSAGAVTASAPSTDPVEQTAQGPRPAPPTLTSFSGLGNGFVGPAGSTTYLTPSDNNIAVGPTQITEMVNTKMAMFDKTGTPTYGPVNNNTIFSGFPGLCGVQNSGDAVVRYDQLAQRWVYILPIFLPPYFLCYAVSTTTDALGPYNRYQFPHVAFPDYPRVGIWPDGYYTTVSSGDTGTERISCVVDRISMLQGSPVATEQCVTLANSNFVLPADLDGQTLPPAGAPNIQLAATVAATAVPHATSRIALLLTAATPLRRGQFAGSSVLSLSTNWP